MAEIQNFVWPVGEDLKVELIYAEGEDAETAEAIDLSSGYAVRMDIVVPSTSVRIYTFNSEELADVDPKTTGAQPDEETEGVLSSGAGDTPNISFTVDRSLTLPGGAVYEKFKGSPKVTSFAYDIFLRNTAADTQVKILKGSITPEDSVTLWL